MVRVRSRYSRPPTPLSSPLLQVSQPGLHGCRFYRQYMGADSTWLPLSPKPPLSGYATTAYRRYTLDPRVRCAAGAPNGGKPALRVCAPPTTGARFFTHLMFYLYIRYITFAGDIEFFGVYDTELLFYCSAHFFCRFKTVF